MLFNLCGNFNGVLQYEYRKQLLAAISVTLVTFGHGIILGWLSPMIMKLQSTEENPLSFAINLEQVSWIGALICLGGMFGNTISGYILNRFGRKPCLYFLAVPHLLAWGFIYFANSVEYLYVSRLLAGTTGGGCYVVLPIFIGEISDCKIRGRLTSFFPLTLNSGIFMGYLLGANLNYYIIPCACVVLPVIYLISITQFPETPDYLVYSGQNEKALESFRFYKNYPKVLTKAETTQLETEFEELKTAVLAQQKSEDGSITLKDICNKSTLRALSSSFVLIFLNVFSGIYALISFMSSAFASAKVELDPNTNTIIIGAVQIIGTIVAIFVVDRYGRKILMIISSAGMGAGLAFFGMYGFFAEETTLDLSNHSQWLPLILMAFTIFSANIGVVPVTFVLLVEILPAKIRSRTISVFLVMMSLFGFIQVKTFPICLNMLGLATTMWICASACAFGLFYTAIFIKETKGKSLNKE